MSLDPVKILGRAIADITVEQSSIKQNLSPEDDSGQLVTANTANINLMGTITATAYLFPTTSFVIDHPVYSLLDSGGEKAFWKLSDLTDSVGSAILTNVDSVTFSSGLVGNCANIIVSGQKLTSTSNLGIDGGTVSISAWIKSTLPTTDTVRSIVSQGSTTSFVGYELYLKNESGTQSVRFIRVKYPSTSDIAIYNVSLSSSIWNHIVGTYDGTNLKLYVNGVYRATQSASGNGSSGGYNGVVLGSTVSGSSQSLMGQLDAVGVWSTALLDGGVSLNNTATLEIAKLYNNGLGVEYPNNSLSGLILDGGYSGVTSLLYRTTF